MIYAALSYASAFTSRSSGDRFHQKLGARPRLDTTPMHLWDQGKALKRVVIVRTASQPTSSFKSATKRFGAKSKHPVACPSLGETRPIDGPYLS